MRETATKKGMPKPARISAPIPRGDLPLLFVDSANLSATAKELAQRFAVSTDLFERGEDVVKVIETAQRVAIEPLNVYSIVNEAHAICRPVIETVVKGECVIEPVTLPHRVAQLFLNLTGQRGLRVLRGICLAPLLSDDGSIRAGSGYDEATGYWCESAQLPPIPASPTRDDALDALLLVRTAFATFPFADAGAGASSERAIVDLAKPPGQDESTFLTALLTAACRPSLSLAPALLVRAPQFSGAGTGKGHLVRALSQIAFGLEPKAFTSGGDRRELGKRLESALIEAAPIVFLDNCNSEQLSSNILAQVITESAVMARLLGQSKMVPLTANAFIALTGNAVRVSEDLARRFLVVELDARCENPEQRWFSEDFGAAIIARRAVLLGAVLTIWRWGRMNRLEQGTPLGSFEQWSKWCRDPLLTLGCQDPVRRVIKIKSEDPQRERAFEFMSAWFARHGSRPLKLRQLDPAVRGLAGRDSRQNLANFVRNLEGTRAGGFVLTISKPVGKWGTAEYSVSVASDAGL
jgi:hypothetical protein